MFLFIRSLFLSHLIQIAVEKGAGPNPSFNLVCETNFGDLQLHFPSSCKKDT